MCKAVTSPSSPPPLLRQANTDPRLIPQRQPLSAVSHVSLSLTLVRVAGCAIPRTCGARGRAGRTVRSGSCKTRGLHAGWTSFENLLRFTLNSAIFQYLASYGRKRSAGDPSSCPCRPSCCVWRRPAAGSRASRAAASSRRGTVREMQGDTSRCRVIRGGTGRCRETRVKPPLPTPTATPNRNPEPEPRYQPR